MIARFKIAWQYFMIAWRNNGDITEKMLRQLKKDNVVTAHMTLYFHEKYSHAERVDMGYNPLEDSITIKIITGK